jgi:hypothetical protein
MEESNTTRITLISGSDFAAAAKGKVDRWHALLGSTLKHKDGDTGLVIEISGGNGVLLKVKVQFAPKVEALFAEGAFHSGNIHSVALRLSAEVSSQVDEWLSDYYLEMEIVERTRQIEEASEQVRLA